MVDSHVSPPRKRVGVAVLLGVFVPGLGQAYAGHPRRAALRFLGAARRVLLLLAAVVLSGHHAQRGEARNERDERRGFRHRLNIGLRLDEEPLR